MQKNNDQFNIRSTATHHATQRSTTLNRRYVKRPGPIRISISDGDSAADLPTHSSASESTHYSAPEPTRSFNSEPTYSSIPEPISYQDLRPVQESVRASYEPVPCDPEAPLTPRSLEEAIVEAKAHPVRSQIAHFTDASYEENLDDPVIEKPSEERAFFKIPVDSPAEPSPYDEILAARRAALEVKKVAARNAEFYPGPTLRERKDSAIAEAIAEATAEVSASSRPVSIFAKSRHNKQESVLEKNVSAVEPKKVTLPKAARKRRSHRFALAFFCSIACISLLGFGVYHLIPDISVKVTAMQSGIEAKYPSYIPRDYALSGVYINDNEEVVMEFKGPNEAVYRIAESESSWDSNALLNNYVKKKWSADSYSATREGGITIYIHESSAVWVNGGMLYRIEPVKGTLTKKQLKNIALSV